MIADNDPGVLELLTTDLALEGYTVVATVMSGEEAEVACAQHRPDVFICDHRMPPGPSGLETIREVAAAGTAGACILYTNYRLPGLVAKTEKLGAVYVAKGALWQLRRVLAELVPPPQPHT